MSENNKNNQTHGTHAVSFRVSEEQYKAFQELLQTVPGSDAGSMYREVFQRGLHDLAIFCDKHLNLTCQETAAEVEDDQ